MLSAYIFARLFPINVQLPAVQNRTFGRAHLGQGDCLARSVAQAERGEFPRKRRARLRATRRGKRGKQQRSGSGFPLKQAKNEKADAACAAPALFLFVFRLTHSLRSAITGSFFAAICAGIKPEMSVSTTLMMISPTSCHQTSVKRLAIPKTEYKMALAGK